MYSYSRRRAFAAGSLAVLCVMPAAIALLVQHGSLLDPLPVGERVPTIDAMSIDGRTFVNDTADRKKLLLVFFTPACSHCRRELANLDELLPKYADKLDILGVSLDNLESTRALTTDLNLRFPIVVGENEKMKKTFKVNILPSFFCIDEFRVLRNYYTGEHSLAVDEHLIEDFISSPKAP